jgi:hypothetical protein
MLKKLRLIKFLASKGLKYAFNNDLFSLKRIKTLYSQKALFLENSINDLVVSFRYKSNA